MLFRPNTVTVIAANKHLHKLFSSSVNSIVVQNLPSNLKLADPSALLPEKTIVIPKNEYLFGRVNVPESFPVLKFNSPGEYLTNSAKLESTVFGSAIRKDIVLDVVKYHRLKHRMPYKTKRKSEIRGSNKKPHPQKGTGRAQAGHKRNAIWRGGHKAHGPVLRSFAIKMNRRVLAQATMIGLAAKYLEGNFVIVDNFATEQIKTSHVFNLLKAHGLSNYNLLLIDVEFQREFELSSRNIPRVEMMTYLKANVYEIVRQQKVVITVKALDLLQEKLMAQYFHKGMKGSYKKKLDEFRLKSELGRQLGPQSALPFSDYAPIYNS